MKKTKTNNGERENKTGAKVILAEELLELVNAGVVTIAYPNCQSISATDPKKYYIAGRACASPTGDD